MWTEASEVLTETAFSLLVGLLIAINLPIGLALLLFMMYIRYQEKMESAAK